MQQQPAIVYTVKTQTSKNYGIFSGILSLVQLAVVGFVIGIIIGIVTFIGFSVYTCIASLIVPTIAKISTWAVAASELKSCIFMSLESLFVGAIVGIIKNFINKKREHYSSYSLNNNNTLIPTVFFSSAVGMVSGFFSGLSGVHGIIQSTIFNATINSQSSIGMIITSGGAGGIAGGGGILLFLLILLVFLIQGIIIGLLVGMFFGTFSGLINNSVKHGITETLIFSLDKSDDKFNTKVFLKYIGEGIIISCILGLLQGIITGKEAVINYETLKNINTVKTVYKPENDYNVIKENNTKPTENKRKLIEEILLIKKEEDKQNNIDNVSIGQIELKPKIIERMEYATLKPRIELESYVLTIEDELILKPKVFTMPLPKIQKMEFIEIPLPDLQYKPILPDRKITRNNRFRKYLEINQRDIILKEDFYLTKDTYTLQDIENENINNDLPDISYNSEDNYVSLPIDNESIIMENNEEIE